MFPESKWVANDVLNLYVSDEGDQRLLRAYLDDLNLEYSLEGIYAALDRLERSTESSSQEPDSQEPLIEESVNQEPLSEDPDSQELDSDNNVVEDSEQKKVDTSEIKLQKLLANVLKNKKHKRRNYTHDKESINDSGTLYEG